ncbi:trigger factor [Synergistales bacterium]|nr:trigger factor [Synergistales bacterium]
MKTELLGQEKNIVKVKIEFTAEEFAVSLQKTLQEIAERVKIPGFRKGRVSRNVIEMRLGRESIYDEAFWKMLPKAMDQAIADYGLILIDTPIADYKLADVREGESLSCEVSFEVSPEITLPELDEIEVERQSPRVTEDMVEDVLKLYKKEFSTLKTVERAAAEGDVLSVSCVSHVFDSDGKDTEHPLQDQDVDLSADIRAEIKNALLGKDKGDSVSAEFDVESEFADKNLAGKKLRHDFTILEIKERVIPELAPELLKEKTGENYESFEDFKTKTRERLEIRLNEDATNAATNAALNDLVAKSELEVPASILKKQIDRLTERDTANARERYNLTLDEYLTRFSINKASYDQTTRESAEAMARRTLVLDAVGEANDINIEQEEIDAEIDAMAKTYGAEPSKLRVLFHKEEDRLRTLVNELYYKKVIKLIMEKVKIRDVDTPLSNAQSGAEGE